MNNNYVVKVNILSLTASILAKIMCITITRQYASQK